MSKWIFKAIVQKGISTFPNPERINHFFQKYITKGFLLSDYHFGAKVQHAADHFHYLKKYGSPSDETRILELGTGWYPIIPIFFYLTHSGQIHSIDIQSWINKETQLICIQKIIAWEEQGKLEKFKLPIDQKRLQALRHIKSNPEAFSFEDINNHIGLSIQIVDARQTNFQDNSFDFVCSNNTFEHIHADVLPGILREFKRILKSDGLMSHFIDMTDHFSHFDKKITVYNFLKFSQKRWKRIDNNIQPQNRWRLSQYLDLYESLNIPITASTREDQDKAQLATVKIHSEFSTFSPADLAITHAYIVSKF